MCSLKEKGAKKRALVEACEPNTIVNLHFHSVTSPLLSLPFLLVCHTLDKLEITLG